MTHKIWDAEGMDKGAKVVAQKVRGSWVRGRLARMICRCVHHADKMSAYPGKNATTF